MTRRRHVGNDGRRDADTCQVEQVLQHRRLDTATPSRDGNLLLRPSINTHRTPHVVTSTPAPTQPDLPTALTQLMNSFYVSRNLPKQLPLWKRLRTSTASKFGHAQALLPKVPLPLGVNPGSLPTKTWLLIWPQESAPQTAYTDRFSCFARSRSRPTDRGTDTLTKHAASVIKGRISCYALRCGLKTAAKTRPSGSVARSCAIRLKSGRLPWTGRNCERCFRTSRTR